ncbi:hypothetical protein [Streptomyces tendae]|uniref:hypothetical protein n=1 Tax=Streptomyces tendae TaxID=1932 RepID=UPI003D749D38
MGRNMKPLEDDGRPLTSFVADLRELHRAAGAPTLTVLNQKSGYGQPRLSELFNGKRMPSQELVRDVVTVLGGDADQWVERLEAVKEAERNFQTGNAQGGSVALEVKIAQLEAENKRLRQLVEQPNTVIAQARAALEYAGRRVQAAGDLERRANSALERVHVQHQLLLSRIPEAEKQVAAIISEGVNRAAAIELEGRERHQEIVEQARGQASQVIRKAEQAAQQMLQTAERRAKEHRASSYASVSQMLTDIDQLRVEAEQAVAQASAHRTSLERRAKIEIERLVRGAQERLEEVGITEEVHALEILLRDFNIAGSHIATRGRHARRPQSDQSSSPAATSPPVLLPFADPGVATAGRIVLPRRATWKGWTVPQQPKPDE